MFCLRCIVWCCMMRFVCVVFARVIDLNVFVCFVCVLLYDAARHVVCVVLCLCGLLLFVCGLCEVIVRCCVCFVSQVCLCVVWLTVCCCIVRDCLSLSCSCGHGV